MHIRTMLTSLQAPALLIAILCPGGPSALAGEAPSWPQFRGPKGDGLSTETGLLKQWPEAGPKLLWTAEGLGFGFGSVTVAEGKIYAAGDLDKRNVITALGMDGAIQWRFENGSSWDDPTPGARSTPTFDGGRVYHENAHGAVVCLDANTGQRNWGRNLAEEFGGRYSSWGYAESLVIDGDHVLCCPGGDTAMVALNKNTGGTVWRSPSAGEPAGYSTPVLAEFQGLRMVLTMSERSLIGVNADTGGLLFRFEHFTPKYVANCVSPVYHDGHVLISGGSGKGCVLLKLSVDGKAAAVEPVWRTENLDNRHGGVILLDGFLYGASQLTNKGKWVCLEWQTGTLRYAEPGVGEGSITSAEGMLYTLSEGRKLGLVKATPAGHEVTSQFEIPAGGKGATWAHPVVCGGRLYVRHGDRLYAYDVQAG
jgi:outer membrane protein assembly factor BamB